MYSVVEKDDRYIIYNIATDALVTIYHNGQKLEEILERLAIKEFLRNNLVLLEDEESNLAISRYLINKSKYSDDTLVITDAMSYKCNLQCVYCMQQNTFKNVQELSVEERLDVWEQLYRMTNSNKMDVYFFGGEPFLFPDNIRKMIEGACGRNMFIRDCYAITNGVNISEEVIQLINEFDFKHIQITLDGTKEIHNKRRRSNLIENSFDIIIRNMHLLLEKTKTDIIINTVLDRKNLTQYLNLIEYIQKEFKEEVERDDSRLVFNVGEECHPVDKSNYTIENIASIDEYSEIIIKATKYMIDCGLKVNKPIPTPICIYKKENDVLISPEGDLYKCITGLGVPEFKLISRKELFDNPIIYFTRQVSKIENELDDSCKQCQYLSLCNGGCSFNAFINNKRKNCNRGYLEKNLTGYIEIMEKLLIRNNELASIKIGDMV